MEERKRKGRKRRKEKKIIENESIATKTKTHNA